MRRVSDLIMRCLALGWGLIGLACASRGTQADAPRNPEVNEPAPMAGTSAVPVQPREASPNPPGASPSAPPVAAGSASVSRPVGPAPELCGELKCWHLHNINELFPLVLPKAPGVLAVGEAHTRKEAAKVVPTVKRFEHQIFPELVKRHASELVVELLKPAPNCAPTTQEVKKKQRVVTQEQAATNQSDYIQLGHTSNQLGVVPYVLEPSCEAYRTVLDAGDDAMVRMLEVIKQEALRRLSLFWLRQKKSGGQGLVVAYGGAMHNDVTEDPARASFAFGQELVRRTGGAYVALDLIVPEYIREVPAWQRLAWYPYFDRSVPHTEYTLFQTGPESFTLIFPTTETVSDPGVPEAEKLGSSPAPLR